MSYIYKPNVIQDFKYLDSELDWRINNLDIGEEKAKAKEHILVSKSTCTPKNHGGLVVLDDSSHQTKKPNSDVSPRIHIKQLSEKDGNCAEISSSEEEHSLDEFLTHAAEMKIKFLKKKCINLEKTLALTQQKIKSVNSQINDANSKAKDATEEGMVLKRSLSSKERFLEKKEKELHHTVEELRRKKDECHRILKDYSAIEKKLKEEEKNRRSIMNQNKSLKMKLTAAQSKMNDEVKKSQEREKLLQAQIAEREQRVKTLQRHLHSLSILVKKQDELTVVLQQQKANIAMARMTKSLEEQLLSLIYSTCSDKETGNSDVS